MERPGAVLPPRCSLADAPVRADPYPTYRVLRERPVWRGGPGEYVVTRHDDVRRLLADPRLTSGFPPEYTRFTHGDGPAAAFLRRIVLHQDGVHHHRLRKLMVRAFSVSAVRGFTRRLDDLVVALLRGPVARGRLDVVDDLAFPLPVSVVCELTGIPAAERDTVRPHAYALGTAFTTTASDGQRAIADAAVTWLRDYVGALLDERRRRPTDDLLSAMAAAEDGGERLTRDEIVDNVVFLFFAGFETTSSLLTTGVAALLADPGQAGLLRTRPDLVPAAVEEFLRFDAPIQSRLRHVREPVRIGDQVVRPGRTLLLLLGSANRDGAVFADADVLDVRRTPNPHLAFGGGGHLCLGAALAREETAVALRRLLGAAGRLDPDGPATRAPDSAFRTFASLPVALSGPAGGPR